MAEHIIINEVGPRDGLQSQGRTLMVDERLALIGRLLDCGIEAVEVGSFVSPKAVPQMAGTGELVSRLERTADIAYSALVPNMRGYELAREAGAKSVAVVLSATETMNQRNINMSLAQARAAAAQVLAQARRDGIEGRAYVAVAFECPFEGKTSAAAVGSLAHEMFDAGAGKVIVADTIGAANPAAVRQVLGQIGWVSAGQALSCHFHDTRAMALANVLAALDHGVREFDCSIGGLGGCPFSPGASGNLATEDLVLMLQSMGLHTGIDLERLLDTVQFAGELTGVTLGGRSFPWLSRQRERQLGGA